MTTRTDATAVETAYRTHRRFDRAARLFTEPGLARLMGARVIVFGMGGVGSFAAESLARSAVGKL
ncbi:MAG TPA: ThiF family adenylyltransferase, partial [Polyangiales bacterium]